MTPTIGGRIPWYIWLSAMAVTSAVVGIQWDISWHRSIGRDTFLTPAHIAIYMCGILAGIFCSYLILVTTFTNSPLRNASVRVWGFRGPLGAFVAAWGGFVMLTSAPFDDWWHGAYGLDVKILSPPHIVLALGIFSIEAGAVLLVAAQRNRATEASRHKLDLLFLYVGTAALILLRTITLEYSALPQQHTTGFYLSIALTVPFILALFASASERPWPATTITGLYSLFWLGLLWILPLFPASPKLGPVYHQVTHFVPPGFPLLLIFPGIAMDLLWARFPHWSPWKKALLTGPLFLAIFLAFQWPFSTFLQSPGARNAFFRSNDLDYLTAPTSLQARYVFYQTTQTAREILFSMGLSTLAAIIGTRLGLGRGSWIRDIRR